MKLFAAAGKDPEVDSVPECSTEWRESCAATLMTTVCRVSYRGGALGLVCHVEIKPNHCSYDTVQSDHDYILYSTESEADR